ncbi:Cold shock domain-containing protein 4 [Porphyridium purpureum]|uniref:Cold shock domain-containing protein 4 n=1 Tax=Porphyridium purpureum TaxID=35688 RepID=A0A5J4Z099_PORPP|nr:Cold shock domain-containing protein 4 [Porphyridium purpureum]|eukprot:POR5257..scf208_2
MAISSATIANLWRISARRGAGGPWEKGGLGRINRHFATNATDDSDDQSVPEATDVPVGAKRSGRCKWFDKKRGYGYVTCSQTKLEVFVHQSQLKYDGFRALRENEKVEFVVAVDERTGLMKAMNVTGPDGAPLLGLPGHKKE